MSSTLEVLRQRIKRMRTNKDLTLKEVANYLGIKEATAQRYESGEIKNIPYDNIVLMAELFDCSPQYLMGWEETNQKYWNTLKEKEMAFETFIHNFCRYESVYQINSDYVNIILRKNPDILYKVETGRYDDFLQMTQERIDFEFNSMLKKANQICVETKNNNLTPNAAHALSGATEEEKKHDDDIMDDENF